jgi:hypothetical protein
MSITCKHCMVDNDDDARFCKQCGKRAEIAATCNMCGETCRINTENYGMTNAKVSGGYESTAGNGHGALDDCETYTFSLCEFCLDWLFSKFKVPVDITDYMNGSEPGTYVPAAQRVATDECRKMKDEFTAEHDKRAALRNVK